MHNSQRFYPCTVLCSIGLFAQLVLPTYASNLLPTDNIKNGGGNLSLGNPLTNGSGGSSNTVDCDANPEHPVCGDPPTNGGAGDRGSCDRPETYENLPEFTILAPEDRDEGLTVREFPTFLVYLPFDLDENSRGKFILRTLEGTEIYSQEFPDTAANQILSITIPSDPEMALAVGQTYRVEFRVSCGEPGNATPLIAPARVQRVTPESSASFWYDDLADAYDAESPEMFESLLESEENLQGIPEALTNHRLLPADR